MLYGGTISVPKEAFDTDAVTIRLKTAYTEELTGFMI